VRIAVKSGDMIIARRRERAVKPPEMIRLIISPERLKEAAEGEGLLVELVDEGGAAR
jgi:Lhr-like helicase